MTTDLTFMQRMRVTDSLRIKWYRTLASLMSEGHNIFDVLEDMGREFNRVRNPLGIIVSEVKARMAGGGTREGRRAGSRRSFGSEVAGLVPDNEAKLIEAGETSGSLSNGFTRAAIHLESMGRLKSEVYGPLREPVFLLILLLGVLVFFSVEVLPAFNGIAPRYKWPVYARWFGAVADASVVIAVTVAGLLFAAGAWLRWAAARWTNDLRYAADRHIWPMTLISKVQAAAMLTSLAGFVAARVPFAYAVETMKEGSSPYMRQVYNDLHSLLRNGQSPADALTGVHIIPVSQHWLIRINGRSKDFAKAMESISNEMIEATLLSTRAVFGVINLLLKVLVAGFVIWTLASMFGVVQTVR